MAIFKRAKSRYYWTKFKFQDRIVQRSTRCTNKTDARKFEVALKFQLNMERIGIEDTRLNSKETILVKDAVATFLKWSKVHQKQSTFRRYETSSKAIIEILGGIEIGALRREDVESFIERRLGQTRKAPFRKLKIKPRTKTRVLIKPATVNREIALLRFVFGRLLEDGKIRKNPVLGIRKPPEDNSQTRVVTKDEFRLYTMAASQPLRDVAVIMYQTGMRPSEVLALRQSDVDFTLGKIKISSGKTKAARRQIRMTRTVFDILSARAQTRNEYLFPGGKDGKGKAPTVNLHNAHSRALKRAKIRPFRIYDLRHTFATEFVAAGNDIVTLAAVLGHSNLSMVTRYAHPTEQHQDAAFDRLERLRDSYRGPDSNVVSIAAVRK